MTTTIGESVLLYGLNSSGQLVPLLLNSDGSLSGGSSSGGAPTDADYIVGSTQSGLTNEILLANAIGYSSTFAGFPGAATVPEGTLYFAADRQALYRSTAGVIWVKVAGASLKGLVGVDPNLAPSEGQALIYDASAGSWKARGGGLVLLEQHTAAGSASLDFTSFISSLYDEYMFEFIDIVPATDDTVPYMRMGTGAGPSYDSGANYGWAGWRWLHNGDGPTGASSGQTAISLALAIHKAANWPPMSGSIKLFNPQSSTYKIVTGQFETFDTAVNVPVGTTLAASYQATTVLTAVQFLMSSGNITSGTIRAYGITK